MKLLYQILCEVKVLHEYYLTNPDNTVVFQDATQTERLAWLTNRYAEDQPVIGDDLEFVLPAAMVRPFANQGMVLVKSLGGFLVGIQVNETVQSNGTITYAPAIALDPTFNIVVLMRQVQGEFALLTNGRLQRPVQTLYYFTNEQVQGPRTAPVLSAPISPWVSGYPYEQGELSAIGSVIYTSYYIGSTQAKAEVPGDGFANENDRLITGTDFDYTFLPSDNVTEATFTLQDQSGNTITSQKYSSTQVLDTVELNFSAAVSAAGAPLFTLPLARASDPILYTLAVTGTGGYSKTIKLIFYDTPAELLSAWGVIQLQVAVSNSGLNLLDSNGNLYAPVLPAPDVSNSPYPVFEIRCKSRYTFWRYYSDDPSKTLNAPSGALASFLQTATGGALTTQAPVPSTYLPFFFSTDPSASTPSFTYLPNPVEGVVIEVDGNQLFSNIWVPESGIFPVS
jgi:hypothetical protein